MRLRLFSLLICLSPLGFAGTWSGFLKVDSNCFASEQSNVSQDATTVSRDMRMALRNASRPPKPRNLPSYSPIGPASG